MHLISTLIGSRKWLFTTVLLLGLCTRSFGQSSSVVIYVDSGQASGTTTQGVNGSDQSNMQTLGLMVQQLNAGQTTSGGSPLYTYTLVEVTSFTQAGRYSDDHPNAQINVVAHSEVLDNGTFLQPDPLGPSAIWVDQKDGPAKKVDDAISDADSSAASFYYCGMYGDNSPIDADDVGASIAAKNYQTYPKNVTQKGAMDPTKSGGKSNPPSGGSGGATTAPPNPNTGLNGYWQATPVYWETWVTLSNGGGILTGHNSTTWSWFATGDSGGGSPNNTVLN